MTVQEASPPAGTPPFGSRRHYRQTMHDRCSFGTALACDLAREAEPLRQYYALRETVYTATWGLADFDGQEDAFDRAGHIFIASIDRKVIGGVRLNIRRHGERDKLPLEQEGLDLDRILSGHDLDGMIGGEISRFALHPSYWGGECSVALLRSLSSFGLEQGLDYALCVSPLAQARNYHRMARQLSSVREYRILGDAGVPDKSDYQGIRMVLSMLRLR
jgi:hypothetical protein